MRVNVNRTDLLRTLRDNRNVHKREFEEAWLAYLEEAAKELRKAARDAAKTKKGERVRVPVLYAVPTLHEEDYDRVIGLLEMSSDDEVSLDDKDYSRFVKDNWDWKQEFEATTSLYKFK